MDTLHIAYKILYSLEHEDRADYMGLVVSPEKLKVSETEWLKVIRILSNDGYISGVQIQKNVLGETEVDIQDISITMKGGEYLRENNIMKQIAKVATNIISII